MEQKEEELYVNLLKGMVNLLKLKKYNEISLEELCKTSGVKLEDFNSNFKNIDEFTINSIRYLYNQSANKFESVYNFNELCKGFILAHLKVLEPIRGNNKVIDEDFNKSDNSKLYYICFKEISAFLNEAYKTRKNPEIKEKDEELYLYRLSSRILCFLAYFYNNPNVTIETMSNRIDSTLKIN